MARATRRRAAAAPTRRPQALAIAAGVALFVLAPYLLSNLAYYHNPVYPLFQDVFTASTPTMHDAAAQVRFVLADWHHFPAEALGERLKKGIELLGAFSFVPHYSFANDLPVFGSLFTLTLPFLLFVPRPRRLALGAALTLGALLLWALSYLVDRNLQTFLPVMVAVTAAVLVRAWELGWLARAGVAVLVVAQVAWAAPLYFSGSDRMTDAITLLKSGMDGHAREVLRTYRRPQVELGESLPADAVVVLHTLHDMLGINRPVFLDYAGFQSLIDYRPFKTPRDLYERLRAIGATHVVWTPGRTDSVMQNEVIFDAFAQSCGTPRAFGSMVVAPLPAASPPLEPPYRVLTLGLGGYADGLYPVESLDHNDQFPPSFARHGGPPETASSPAKLLDQARVVMIGTQASAGDAQQRLDVEFREIQTTSDFRVLLRRSSGPSATR